MCVCDVCMGHEQSMKENKNLDNVPHNIYCPDCYPGLQSYTWVHSKKYFAVWSLKEPSYIQLYWHVVKVLFRIGRRKVRLKILLDTHITSHASGGIQYGKQNVQVPPLAWLVI